LYGVISRRSVSLIIRTGSIYRRVPQDRQLNEDSNFHIGVSRACGWHPAASWRGSYSEYIRFLASRIRH
jgi:hypothetical protein